MAELPFAIVLSAHLLCVNIAAGAPLIALGCEWGERSHHPLARRAGRYLTFAGLVTLIAGLALGLLLFALRWSPNYSEAVSRLTYKLAWGGGELAFSVLLYLVSYALWRGDKPAGGGKRRLRGALALLNGANLLYHFPFLFLVMERVVRGDVGDPGLITAARFRGLMFEGETPALAVHVIVASVAMAGVTLLGLALRLQREGARPEDVRTVGIWGGRAAVVPTLVQVPVGLWIMSTLHPRDQSLLLGGSTAAFLFFIAGVSAALWLLQLLATIAAGETDRGRLIKGMSLSVATVLLMTVAWRFAHPG